MEQVRFRRFNREGIQRMEDFLAFLPAGPPFEPADILHNSHLTETIGTIQITPETFDSKFDLARYIDSLLKESVIASEDLKDVGLWSWLTLYFFDQLCHKTKKGRAVHEKKYRWIPDWSDYRKLSMHLLYGPYHIYKLYDESKDVVGILSETPSTCSSVLKHIASRQDLIENRELIRLITGIYYNDDRSSSINSLSRKFSPVELVTVLDQLTMNWDLQVMSAEEILSLLNEL